MPIPPTFPTRRRFKLNPAKTVFCPRCASDNIEISVIDLGDGKPDRLVIAGSLALVVVGAAAMLRLYMSFDAGFYTPVNVKLEDTICFLSVPLDLAMMWVGLRNLFRRPERITRFICTECGHVWE